MYQSNPGKRIRVGDIEMEYEEHGGGDRPFVLVHGFTGSRDDWKEHLPYLGKRGRTIAVDQRGHGGSTNTGDAATYRIEQLAADLAGFLDAVGAPESTSSDTRWAAASRCASCSSTPSGCAR